MRFKTLLCHAAGLLEAPPLAIDAATRAAFDQLLESGGTIDYRLGRPRHEFLRYAAEERGYLLHGSGRAAVEEFVPRDQTDFGGKLVRAVFATSDGIWPIFFAVVRRQPGGSIVNNCIQVPERRGLRCFYYFSTSTDPRDADSWKDGFVYVLARDGFTKDRRGPEWTSPQTVEPVAVLPVTPGDFPFLRDVRRHRTSDSLVRHYARLAVRRSTHA